MRPPENVHAATSSFGKHPFFCTKMTRFTYTQARSQGGFGGCGRTPLFLGPKKKVDGVRIWQPCVFRVRSRLHAPPLACVGGSEKEINFLSFSLPPSLIIHGPEPNLESVAV